MENVQKRVETAHAFSGAENEGLLSVQGNIKSLRKLVQGLVFMTFPLIGCIPEKTATPIPISYEQKKQQELKESEPTKEEIQFFLDIFHKHPIKEFVDENEEKWISESVKFELAHGFARLSKTLKINPKWLGEDLSYVLENTKMILRKVQRLEGVYGEVDAEYNINIYPIAKADTAETIFHEYLHLILSAHKPPEVQSGIKNIYYLLEEGSTELMTKIAFPNTCDTAYPSATLLIAALGPDFYKTRIHDITKYLKTSVFIGSYKLENPNEMKKLIEDFMKRWNITGESKLAEIADIFGVQEIVSSQIKPDKKKIDLGDKNRDYHRVLRLRAYLQKHGIDWGEFLKQIAPPNNNFARDWKIIIDIESDDWKQEWRRTIQCDEENNRQR